jgi:hypothetical protein
MAYLVSIYARQYQILMLSSNIERRRGLAYAGEQAGYPA